MEFDVSDRITRGMFSTALISIFSSALNACEKLVSLVVSLILYQATSTVADCMFPSFFSGNWFYMEDAYSMFATISGTKWGELDCKDVYYHEKPVESSIGQNATFFLVTPPRRCYCQHVLWRTPNVLQVRRYLSENCGASVSDVCRSLELPSIDTLTTYFKTEDEEPVSCNSTFDGIYQFSYERSIRGGGSCDNPNSQIRSCHPYFDHPDFYYSSTFTMEYESCRNVPSSVSKGILYQCYGTWYAQKCPHCEFFKFAVIRDIGENDLRESFKCLITSGFGRLYRGMSPWVMSRFANCGSLNSFWDGPVRLALRKNEDCPERTSFYEDNVAK